MFSLKKNSKLNIQQQLITSIIAVVIISFFCFLVIRFLDYRIVAMLLLLSVSVIAMLFDIIPVLVACLLSALIWDFFFIPPLFTFHISNTQDLLMFLMYFVIALVNAVLTFKIREHEKNARDKEEKENAIKLYNTLFNSLSHELRTPIATILGAVDTLKENKDNLSEQNQNILLTEIDNASLRLNRQVENLLNMSRVETGMLVPKFIWCDVNEIIFTVIKPFSNVNTTHKIIFVPNENLPLVKLDVGFTQEIINNIIYNAIQYTDANTLININVIVDNKNCIIVIKDSGKGFPISEIPFVFDKFYRLPNTKTGGTGLGLSIVQGYVKAQNGTVVLENDTKGGAKFTISIPTEITYMNNLKNE